VQEKSIQVVRCTNLKSAIEALHMERALMANTFIQAKDIILMRKVIGRFTLQQKEMN